MASQVKSEQMKKGEAVKELRHLRIQAEKIEREKVTHIYNKHGDFIREFAQFQDIEVKMKQEHGAIAKSLQQQITKIKSQVKKFEREVKEVKPTPESVEKLKVILEDIEAQLNQFKEKQRNDFEELIKEERITNQEILTLEKRFDSWALNQGKPSSASTTHQSKVTSLPSHRDVHKNLPPEVTAFERFVQQTGGMRGGWDEYDHSTFLKYRNRHNGKPSFLRELQGCLPTKTEAEIRQHETWYQEYLMLNERKKEAISQWKQQKELDKELAGRLSDSDSSEDEKVKEETKQKRMMKERVQAKYELNRWKVEKELEKAEEEERRLRDELEKKRKAELAKQKQMEKKKQVVEYRRARQEEEQERKLEMAVRRRFEQEEKQQQSKVIISKFQKRDQESARCRRSAREQASYEAEKEKQERLDKLKSQVRVQVERDPSRLLQPTAGWKERQKDEDTSGRGQVLHMPHRAVPTWRQNMH